MIILDYLRKKNRKKFLKCIKNTYYCSEELGVKKYPNATILPYELQKKHYKGGLIDRDGVFIKKSRFNSLEGGYYHVDKKQIKKINRPAIFVAGMVFPAWGHLLTDDLKFVWWLHSAEGRLYIQNNSPLFAISASKRIVDVRNFIHVLSFLGIDGNEVYLVREATTFSEVILPDPCLIPTDEGDRIWTQEYKTIISSLKKSILKEMTSCLPYQNIYFSRTRLDNHRDFGEKYVEEAFRQKGFKIIYPEEYSIEEQVFLIRNCSCFATTEGSIAHNAIFLDEGKKLILVRKANYINPYQIVIDEMQKIETIYVDAHLSFLNNKKVPMIGPFFVYVNRKLATLLQIPCHFPLWEFLRYIRWSVFHRDILYRIYAKEDKY